jgi:hypothetical protein
MKIRLACYSGCPVRGSLHRTETNVGFVFLCVECFHRIAAPKPA